MKEYFSHDHNARNDRKVIALVNKYKSSGYGIFWATNEMMHEEGGELEFDEITFGAIAKHLNEDSVFIESVITDCINIFKLYILSGEKITSSRVKRNLFWQTEKKQEKSEKAAKAGRLGGIKSGESRRSKQTLQAKRSEVEATKLNEMKLNEMKLDSININVADIPPENISDNKFPLAKDFNGLPDAKQCDFIRLVKVTRQLDVEKEAVNSLWEIFKNQNLTGQKPYLGDEDVYRHFSNWAIRQPFRKKIEGKKEKTAKNIIGIKFINDFKQCEMSDGSIQDLTQNQIDGATYNQINPSSIVKK